MVKKRGNPYKSPDNPEKGSCWVYYSAPKVIFYRFEHKRVGTGALMGTRIEVSSEEIRYEHESERHTIQHLTPLEPSDFQSIEERVSDSITKTLSFFDNIREAPDTALTRDSFSSESLEGGCFYTLDPYDIYNIYNCIQKEDYYYYARRISVSKEKLAYSQSDACIITPKYMVIDPLGFEKLFKLSQIQTIVSYDLAKRIASKYFETIEL